ncbi:MAG: ABC transporter ATP-binding protein [Candidatus Aminicenantes bacterium]|nr:ABC transporter ATP-binding protein [Candidatus Aminicenantes bacterium]
MRVRVENLGRSVANRAILDGIDLEFAPGGVNVILGPNGAGKTTLLRLLGLLDRPGHGEIHYDGRRMREMSQRQRTALRRRCGFVFQSPLLLAGSVEANLRLGARLRGAYVDRQTLARVLQKSGLAGKENQDARLLSGGEKQRLQLARLLLLDPELCLLDEPTANLDPLSVRNIEAAVSVLARDGKTVVLATHNLTQARMLADRIVFLKAGRLVQSGTAADVLSRPLSLDIAEFSAAENIINGTLAQRGGRTVLDCGPLAPQRGSRPYGPLTPQGGSRPCGPLTPQGGSRPYGPLTIEVVSERRQGTATAVIRPEDILVSLEPISSSARNSFPGTVRSVIDLGAVTALSVDCSGINFTVFVTRISCAQMGLAAGGGVVLTFKATAVHLLPTK